MAHVKDFTPQLREALSEHEAAGFVEPVGAARDICFSAYTSSSEWLGAVGVALDELLNLCGSATPQTARRKIESCLVEVGKVWPKFRAK